MNISDGTKVYTFLGDKIMYAPGPPIPLEFLLIKKISTYILRIEKFMSMNGKNRRMRIFSSIVMWPCGVVCAYIMFDLPLNATECQKNAN